MVASLGGAEQQHALLAGAAAELGREAAGEDREAGAGPRGPEARLGAAQQDGLLLSRRDDVDLLFSS